MTDYIIYKLTIVGVIFDITLFAAAYCGYTQCKNEATEESGHRSDRQA